MATTIQGALTELGQQFVDSLRQELDSKRISASGNLYRSVRYEIVGSGDEIGLALFWDDYGDIVDEGRGRSTRGGPQQTWRNKIDGEPHLLGLLLVGMDIINGASYSRKG